MDRVLIVEDDACVADIIKGYVESDPRYIVHWAPTASKALELIINQEHYDLILLDIMLPDIDGLNLCEQLRKTLFCPILFISSIDDDDTIVRALQLGGDDYLVKPFKASVLLARIEVNLRRIRNLFPALQTVPACELELDDKKHVLIKHGKEIYLSPTELLIMRFLLENQQRTLELEEIYRAIWNQPSNGDVRTVPVHIRNLRKKIEDDADNPKYILTVKRIGYCFENPLKTVEAAL